MAAHWPTSDPAARARPRIATLACCVLAAMILSVAVARAADAGGEPATMWDLSDLYPTPADWSAAYERVKAQAMELDRLQGTLGRDAHALFGALDAISSVNRAAARLDVYATLKADEDLRSAPDQERRQQSQALGTLIAQQTSWLAPEVIRLGAAQVQAFEAQDSAMNARFGFALADTLRGSAHTLGAEAEGVLAAAGSVLAQPDAIHSQLAYAELPYPTVSLRGRPVRLDEPAYEQYRQSTDRSERKLVFDTFYGAWKGFESTAGAALAAQVMGDVFSARARRFEGALSAALFASNMPESVYRTVVAETDAALPTLYRYLRLRKARLGIGDTLAYYDNYPPLFPLEHPPEFSVAQSEKITLAALAPMGAEYLGLLQQGFAGRWMDVLPRPGKATGAYMNGSAYDVHPFLLLNHANDYESLSTFAHEWGHAVHTLLANRAQPYEKANYPTFIAESASIANEMLLNDYMIAHARTRAEKLYYLGAGLESIRTTYFRQVMFAEFELRIHREVEQGRALSGARLSDLYCEVVRRYYGEAEGVMKIDPAYCVEWAWVPHFYYDFYVWQYATSMAGAAQFTDAILGEGEAARTRFLDVLRAGGSEYPYQLYLKAGIDMASPAPYRALVARMNRLMDEIEALEKSH
jgi:oligoendopeptidase F